MEFFILNVKNNPCLWNANLVSYRDVPKKEAIWENIAKNCDIANGKEAKNQWKKIRDSHREAMRRRKVHGLVHLHPWKYEEDMKFILQDKPEASDSFNECNDTNDTQENYNSLEESNILLINEESQEQECKERLRERMREEKRSYRDEARRKTIDENRQPNDALGLLFESMCQKTRQLPRHLQLRVQREVFNAVSKAEEETLDPISTYGSPMSSTNTFLNIKEDVEDD